MKSTNGQSWGRGNVLDTAYKAVSNNGGLLRSLSINRLPLIPLTTKDNFYLFKHNV